MPPPHVPAPPSGYFHGGRFYLPGEPFPAHVSSGVELSTPAAFLWDGFGEPVDLSAFPGPLRLSELFHRRVETRGGHLDVGRGRPAALSASPGDPADARVTHYWPGLEPPTRPVPPLPATAAGRIRHAAEHSPGLSEEHRRTYSAAADGVINRLPPAAHALLDKNVHGTTFYPHSRALRRNVWTHDPDDAEAGSDDVLGMYTVPGGGEGSHVHVTLGPHEAENGDYGGGHTAGSLLAHEVGHGLDGPDMHISRTPEWREAHRSEIDYPATDRRRRVRRLPRLTDYATLHPTEGLAEFARLLYGPERHDLGRVERDFPKASAVFKKHGLWPAAEPDTLSAWATFGEPVDLADDRPAGPPRRVEAAVWASADRRTGRAGGQEGRPPPGTSRAVSTHR